MVRDAAILGAAMVAFQLVCPLALGAPVAAAEAHRTHPKAAGRLHASTALQRATAAPPRAAVVPQRAAANPVRTAASPPRTVSAQTKMVRRAVARAAARADEDEEVAEQLATPAVNTADGSPTPLSFHVEAAGPPLPTTPPVLGQQESEAGQLAAAWGDRTFLMINKARGRIILFENGQPVFAGPALTGQSTSDRIPKSELAEKFDNLNAPKTKITPAGRYTVERGFDMEVGGPLFDVHEIRGKDWGIAIHQLYLGIPAERRDLRINSPSDEDKHITYGCINISTPTMRVLMRELPEKGPIPLYILPQDASQTAAFLTPQTSS